jgi:hypothetical protein
MSNDGGPLSPSGEAPFYLALGYFICQYAGVERMVHTLFHALSGIKQNVAKAIIGGMRFTDVLQMLTRIVDLGELTAEDKSRFHDCVDQINQISTFRHALIHRGGFSGPTEIISSNAITAKSQEVVEIWRFTAADIEAAGDDSHRIALKLWVSVAPDSRRMLPTELLELIDEPWRYKPVRPEKPNPQPRKAPR